MIKKFNMDNLNFKKPTTRKNREHNVSVYAEWAIETLKDVHGKDKEADENWYAPAIRMNDKNNGYIADMFKSPFDFLDIGPENNSELADDEIEILEDKIVEAEDA